MPRTKLSEYSTTNSSNTDIEGINIDEGCAPSGINNAIRELMVHLKEFQTGASGDAFTFAGGVLISGTANTITGNVLMSGTNTITGSTTATFAAGAVGTPSIAAHGDTNTGIFFPAADTIAFTEGGAEAMRITSAGDVGIGTGSPSTRLTISSTYTSARGQLSVVSTDTDVGQTFYVGSTFHGVLAFNSSLGYVGTSSNTPLAFITNNTERMRIDSSGNVGIGTSSPAQKLHIIGTSSSGIRLDGGSSPAAILEMQADATASNGVVITATYNGGGSYGPIKFKTGGSEAMRITSGGDFLVGATAVRGEGGFTVSPNSSSGAARLFFNRASTTNSSTVVDFRNADMTVGSISYTNTATTYSTSSDYRLKENIVPMTGALEKVSALKPCTYTWKTDGSSSQGFIAHELQAVIPEAVTGEKDGVDEEGKPVYQGVDTSFLVATLTAAIQELKAENDALKSRLDAAGL